MSNLTQRKKKKRIDGSHLCVLASFSLETLNEGLCSEPCERVRLLSEYGKRHATCLNKLLEHEEFKIVLNHIKQATQFYQGLTEWMKRGFYEMLNFNGDPLKLYYHLTCPYSEMNKVMFHRKLSWAVCQLSWWKGHINSYHIKGNFELVRGCTVEQYLGLEDNKLLEICDDIMFLILYPNKKSSAKFQHLLPYKLRT